MIGADANHPYSDEVVTRTAVQVEARPNPALRPYVLSYVGFELRGFPPGIHLGTPSRALTVIIRLSLPLDVVDLDGATPRGGQFEAVAAGLTSRSVAIRHDGNQHGRGTERLRKPRRVHLPLVAFLRGDQCNWSPL